MALIASSLVGEITIKGGSEAVKIYAQVGEQANKTQSGLDEVKNKSESAGTSLAGPLTSGIRSAIGGFLDFGSKLGTTIFGMKSLGESILGLGSKIFGGNAALEQVKISLEAFVGSAANAGKLLAQLQKFSAQTPFEFPEIQQATLKLLNMGATANQVQGYLYKIGSAVSKVGGNGQELIAVSDIIQQMGNEGKVSYENLKQLSDHNIPAMKLLAQAMHIPIAQLNQMASSGQLGADKLKLLINVLGQFGGKAMEKQSTTFIGLLGTLKDNAQLALNAFSGPLFDMAKSGLAQLGSLVANQAFQNFATGAGKAVAQVFMDIGGAVRGVIKWFSAFDLTPISYGFSQISKAVQTILGPLDNLGSKMGGLKPFFDSLKNTFAQLIVGGISQVGQFLTGLATNLDNLGKNKSVQGFLSSLISGFQQVSAIVGGQFSENFKMVQGILQNLGQWWQSTMQPALAQAMPAFERLGTILFTNLAPALAKVWAVGEGLARQVMPYIVQAFETVAPIVVRVGSFFADNLGRAIQFVSPFIIQASQAIGSFASQIISFVVPIIQQLWGQIKAGLDFIAPIWNHVWPAMQQVLGGVWNMIVGIVKAAWSLVSGIIRIGIDIVQGKWKQVWEDIKGTFKGVWSGMSQFLKGAVDGFWGIIKGGLNFVIGLLNNFITGINDHLKIDVGPVHVHLSIPTIPYLAKGTNFFQGGLAVLGEGREPEMVFGPTLASMPRGSRVVPMSQLQGGGGPPIVHVHLETTTTIDGYRFAGVLMPHIANQIRNRSGVIG